MIDFIRSTWCKSMHHKAMWPMHGKYVCPRCLLEFPVPWEIPAMAPEYARSSSRPVPETVSYAAQQRLA